MHRISEIKYLWDPYGVMADVKECDILKNDFQLQ